MKIIIQIVRHCNKVKFVREVLTILMLCGFYLTANSQTMASLFLMLPSECTPELNIDERKILLQNGEYIIPGGDSLETVEYAMDTTSSINCLFYEFYFTTGQRAFITFELRKFKKNNGKEILVFTRCGGLAASYEQQDVRVFDIQKNYLKVNSSNLLPKNIALSKFIKKETPDSIKTKLGQSINACYELISTDSKNIEYRVFQQTDMANDWIVCNAFEFVWNGSKFIMKGIK